MAFMEASPARSRLAPGSHGDIVSLVSSGQADTVAGLARLTGLARSTVALRVRELEADGYLTGESPQPATEGMGRPSRRIRLNTADRLVAAVDLGASHCRLAVMDVAGSILKEQPVPLDALHDAPTDILPVIDHRLREMLDQAGQPASTVRAIGMGIPAPIEFATGKAINPPILGPGWNGYPIAEFFKDRFGSQVEVVIDNDVNVMAVGEHRAHYRDALSMLYVKVGTGIGCGIIANGILHRGAQGCAGDIGHIQAVGDPHPCRCGKTGCLEALASGAALARALSGAGHLASTPADVIRLASDGNLHALRALHDAGTGIGHVLAALVNFFNPEVIVIGGTISRSHELIAGIREIVHQQSIALATSKLTVEASRTDNAAIIGAATIAIDSFLDPARINDLLSEPGESASGPSAQVHGHFDSERQSAGARKSVNMPRNSAPSVPDRELQQLTGGPGPTRQHGPGPLERHRGR
jgi:predicted NBD/HSP70 family sugar kinase